MVRLTITMLLLAVFFLSGVLLGINRSQQTSTIQENEKELNEVVAVDQIAKNRTEESVKPNEPVIMEVDAPAHFTQKIASVLEGIIKGFYETVVLIVYQMAKALI